MGTTPESFRTFTRVVILFCIFLLGIMGVFETIPLTSDDAAYINQAGLQRTRIEVIANSILILEYRQAAERPQAIANIEASLPIFKQEQATLSANTDTDIQILMQQSARD